MFLSEPRNANTRASNFRQLKAPVRLDEITARRWRPWTRLWRRGAEFKPDAARCVNLESRPGDLEIASVPAAAPLMDGRSCIRSFVFLLFLFIIFLLLLRSISVPAPDSLPRSCYYSLDYSHWRSSSSPRWHVTESSVGKKVYLIGAQRLISGVGGPGLPIFGIVYKNKVEAMMLWRVGRVSQEIQSKTEFNLDWNSCCHRHFFNVKKQEEVFKSQHGAREEPNKRLREELGLINLL